MMAKKEICEFLAQFGDWQWTSSGDNRWEVLELLEP